jgi:hypothetical protein
MGSAAVAALLAMLAAVYLDVRAVWTQSLDEVCTAEALNRVARANPDGTFRIDNVPADGRLIRVRIICAATGAVRGGNSGLFPLANAAIVNVGTVPLEPLPPSIRSLAAVAPPAPLTAPGTTHQLAIAATLVDGSSQDHTAPAAGTSYTSSNPRVCTVSPAGLVTAGIASGTCVVTAVNAGLVVTVPIQVQLGRDADGDGLPDDYEAANACLNRAVADAGADPDEDGASNAQELARGADPCRADTDGDGLSDGGEASRGTNPGAPDTDLDGLLDGDEVVRGCNPLNRDGDGDGLPDGIEWTIANSCTAANPLADTDGDGLTNLDEVRLGTDPTKRDSDFDGLTDGEESIRGTDPLTLDTDGDGTPDSMESDLGTDPLDPTSRPNLAPPTQASGVTLSVFNRAGKPEPPAEAVGPAFSIFNRAGKSEPPAEAAGSTLSVRNQAGR